jgi:hypothetical protein
MKQQTYLSRLAPLKLKRYTPFVLRPTQKGWQRLPAFEPGTRFTLSGALYEVGTHHEAKLILKRRDNT